MSLSMAMTGSGGPSAVSIGAAIITRDNLETLAPLLEQLTELDQVVVVDTGSRDGTRRHVARLGPPFELHRFRWRPRPNGYDSDDWGFAAARNASFSHVTTTHCIWLDSDDTMVDLTTTGREPAPAASVGRKLRQAVSDVPRADVFQLDYIYQVDAVGIPVTVMLADRMLRLAAGWRWRHPVHEVAAPTSDPGSILAVRVGDLAVQHHGVERTSLERNVAMLRAWLRQLKRAGAGPEAMARAQWLMGRTLTGLGRRQESVRWILREYLAKNPGLPPQAKWAGWIDLARIWLEDRDFESARLAALRAIDVGPRYEEAYVLLADVKAATGDDPDGILKLLDVARSCREAGDGAFEHHP
ncbi:MAG TPA: glycosyltransferase, partial [Candidatus Dormibacteraeota bacterium]|nr:glycosyltransferase [Candidatus Dormibacteraeota bacterium]